MLIIDLLLFFAEIKSDTNMVLLVLTVVVLIASVQGMCVEDIIINDRQFLRINICALYFRYIPVIEVWFDTINWKDGLY